MIHTVYISKEERLAVDEVLEQEKRGEHPEPPKEKKDEDENNNTVDTEAVAKDTDGSEGTSDNDANTGDDSDGDGSDLGDSSNNEESKEEDEKETSADTEASKDVAVESITLNKVIASYSEVDMCTVATESFGEDVGAMFSHVGDKLWSATKYLGILGITYAPGAFRYVAKGVVTLVSTCAKGLYFGSIALSKFADAKLHSYSRLRKDVLKIRQVVLGMSDKQPSGSYKDIRRVQYLHVRNMSVDISLSHFATFLSRHIKNVTDNVESSMASINLLVGKVLSGHTESPNTIMVEQNASVGMIKLSVAGYKEPNKNLDTYTYKMDLPGNTRLMAYLPKTGLKDREDIENAYKNSSMFLGNMMDNSIIKEIKYLNKHELLMVLDNLEKLCLIGIAQEKNIRTIQGTRRSIMFSLKGFIVHLLKIKKAVTVRDSLSDFITLKISFIDRCYMKSLFDVNDLSIKVINSGIAFAKQNTKSLKKASN